jgi:2-oxoisovalerate dehydrogenase E2 component (dihydrolipoyl transacylase)
MSRVVFKLSDIGEGITEAEITAWHVGIGDSVREDQPLVDVMTDKATVELTSPVTGLVTARHGDIGEMAKVGSALLEFETEILAAAQAVPASNAMPTSKATPAAKLEATSPPASIPEEQNSHAVLAERPASGAPLASPATRHRAKELGIALESLSGTGPEGRITDQDLDAYIMRKSDQPLALRPARRDGVREIKITGLRRKIAERMQEAKRRIPHFGYVEECDLTELEALRQELNSAGGDQPKLTILPFLMRALMKILPEFPTINARFDDEAGVLQVHEGIHIGIATRTDAGLLVPVIHHAEALDLWGCARELQRVTAAARDGKATREELSGSTITVTSLGPLGGIASTPVINHPEVAIIGPNKLVQRPVVINGTIAIRTMMNLSSSFDHRIIDGHEAASFIQKMKRLLEKPALLFLEGATG